MEHHLIKYIFWNPFLDGTDYGVYRDDILLVGKHIYACFKDPDTEKATWDTLFIYDIESLQEPAYSALHYHFDIQEDWILEQGLRQKNYEEEDD